MFDLEKTMKSELEKVLQSGEIEKTINEKLKETINETVSDYITGYSSEFKKQLEKVIKESLSVDLSKVSFPEYQTMMFNYMKDELDSSMETTAKENIQKTMQKYFKPLTKNEWKLSEIIEKFKESIKSEDEYGGECTIIVNKQDTTTDIYLDKEEDTGQYSCKYQIRIQCGERKDSRYDVWAIEIDGGDMSDYKGDAIFHFDRFLFQLYSANCSIEIDETNLDTYYGESY